MTTLADINATLGATNIALSSVASEQKETSKGISAFLDYIQDKDSSDRMKELEDDREEKKASVLSRVSAAAGTAGGALASAGKSAMGFGKGLFGKLGGALPIGLAGTFLTSLLGSKLLRGGIAGLGIMFGDQIAEMLTGPDAKKEVKDQLAGAIKGGAVGFLLGPRFGAIGFILGGLLADDKIDKQAGKLLDNLKDLKVKFPALGKFFDGITSAVGGGLESINKLLEGTSENKIADITKSIGLIGGVAALLMPGKMLGLLAAATRIMVTTPAGLALLAIAGGGMAINKLIGGDIDDPLGFGASALATGGAYYGGKAALNAMKGDNTAKPNTKGNVSKLSKGSVPNARAGNPFSRMLSTLTRGVGIGKLGLFTLGAATVMLPLAAIGLTEKYFGDEFRDEDFLNKAKQKSNVQTGKVTEAGRKFGIAEVGGSSALDLIGTKKDRNELINISKDSYKIKGDISGIYKMDRENKLENYFRRSAEERAEKDRLKSMDKLVGNPTNVINSGNTTNNVTQQQGVVLGNKASTSDKDDPYSLANQIKSVGGSAAFGF